MMQEALLRRVLGAIALVLAAASGCAIPPRPIVYDTGSDKAFTEDGLYRVRQTRIGAAFVKPGANFSTYGAVIIDPATLSYKSEPVIATGTNRRRGNFRLRADTVDRLKRIYWDAFRTQMAEDSLYEVVSQPGRGVLRISGHIVNVVVNVPPARGRGRDFVHDAGEMTLIVDVRDSMTGEPLTRTVDRRGIRSGGRGDASGYESGSAANFGVMRDIFPIWARLFRGWLDDLRRVAIPAAR